MTYEGGWIDRILKEYNNAIERFLTSDENFKTFKTDKGYYQIVGCDSHGQVKADQIADYIKKNYSWLVTDINKFNINDKYGCPFIAETSVGKFSPNTLLYILNIGHIKKYLGNLDNKKIIEIGGGYGGQLLLINQQWKNVTYTLVDIPNAIKLSKKYLKLFNVSNIKYQTTDDITKIKSDMVISNFAFTELDFIGMEFYYNTFLVNTRLFYMQSNVSENNREKMLILLKKRFAVNVYQDGIVEIITGIKYENKI